MLAYKFPNNLVKSDFTWTVALRFTMALRSCKDQWLQHISFTVLCFCHFASPPVPSTDMHICLCIDVCLWACFSVICIFSIWDWRLRFCSLIYEYWTIYKMYVPNAVPVKSDSFQNHLCTVENPQWKWYKEIVSLKVPCNWCHGNIQTWNKHSKEFEISCGL